VSRHRPFRWDDIFPIVDAPSARLMKIKAACLVRAGVITPLEKAKVDHRADQLIARAEMDRHAPKRSDGGKRAA
jgi:hypothetical protein